MFGSVRFGLKHLIVADCDESKNSVSRYRTCCNLYNIK